MTRRPNNWIAGVCCTLMVASALAQQFEREPPPAKEARPEPYLPANRVDFRLVLAPPPAGGSVSDDADDAAVMQLQKVPQTRWHSAELDDAFVYPRFDESFGRPIDRKTLPALVSLLNRALRDVSYTTFAAKEHFQRPRPYQRDQLRRVCGEKAPPKPEPHPTGGSSYPSGHSAYGWAVAMILGRVAPNRAEALMARAGEYAESRVVCGVHFPSDVAAGQVIAAAVIAHLDASPEFQADLARARAELSPR
ncbi:MAG TPA: phosphatase PAP2 family protein [Steroidobacteraceae bacterium]|nr:phosphatase PAP2 family protein [Steroidobacteraceae bacterium]